MSGDTEAFLREVARVADRTPPESTLSRIGERIGRFVVTGELGRGGMGVVYAARDEKLGRAVAVKVLTARYHDDAEQRARLLREARAASAIEHPNVATMFELDEHDGELFIVMERVDGPSLRARLEEGPLSVTEALSIVRTIAKALGAAHRVGVVHRDLKPENVMFDEDGRLKLLDFGLAKRLPQEASGKHEETLLTKVGSLLGTPSYMSPEQAECGPVSARSDVFSLGVIAYELLAGERPFDRETQVATVFALSHDPLPPIQERNSQVSRAHARLVMRMLEKQPEDRFADGDAVAAALDAIAQQQERKRERDQEQQRRRDQEQQRREQQRREQQRKQRKRTRSASGRWRVAALLVALAAMPLAYWVLAGASEAQSVASGISSTTLVAAGTASIPTAETTAPDETVTPEAAPSSAAKQTASKTVASSETAPAAMPAVMATHTTAAASPAAPHPPAPRSSIRSSPPPRSPPSASVATAAKRPSTVAAQPPLPAPVDDDDFGF